MGLPVLICDDSSLARKQLARILPAEWDIQLSFAEHGKEALEIIRAGQGALTLLDLNMPVMDGYDTLAAIQNEDLPALVIVVSGDIQPEARSRVLAMGALEFIKKPTQIDELEAILIKYGFFESAPQAPKIEHSVEFQATTPASVPHSVRKRGHNIQVSQREVYQEVANIAMGRAGERLAKALDVFVELPIPLVNFIASSELNMLFSSIEKNSRVSAVTQGFTGDGIHGEAVVLFNDTKVHEINKLLGNHFYTKPAESQRAEREALLDISNLIIGACLQGLGEQVHVRMNPAHPIILGQNVPLAEILNRPKKSWEQVLAIEIGYRLEENEIDIDLLLLFPGDSLPVLNRQLAYLLEGI